MLSIKTGAGWRDRFCVLTKTGSEVTVEISVTPIKNSRGVLIGFIDIVRDISDLVKTEKDLQDAYQKLEVVNEKLLVVGGLVRHDIANKLSVLNLHIHTAKKKGTPQQALEAAQVTSAQITRILEFSRDYETLGQQELRDINVEQTFREVVSLFPALKKVSVFSNCQDIKVLADSLLKEIFYNLLDNSIKYGEKNHPDKTQLHPPAKTA